MAIKRGAAVIWGLSSFTASGTLVGGTGVTLNAQSVRHRKSAEELTVQNAVGDTVAAAYVDANETISVDVIASADTLAHVQDGSLIPAPGTQITIVDSEDSGAVGNAGSSNMWLFVEGEKTRGNKQSGALTFQIKRWTANNVAATVS